MTRRIHPQNGNADSESGFGETDTDPAFERVLEQVARTQASGPLPEGALVGEYRLVKLLGKGTFGTVYHGAHTVIGKQAALKVLNPSFSEDANVVQRFIDEARAVNRIAHPNIVDIFGFGVLQDGRKYCVMELLEGETLSEFLDAVGTCSGPDAARILIQIAAALDAAHDHQIVHRDLKPDNIFISRKPASAGVEAVTMIKLLDFGIARVADKMQAGTASGLVLGTPAYMSPEQCRGDRVDRRTDVYALGVVAFQMLTGRLPFEGENSLQFVSKHLAEAPPLATSVNPELPPAVDALLLRLLAKSPQERPERASVAVRELIEALGVESLVPAISAVPSRARTTLLTSRKKRRWFLGVAGAAVLGTVLLVAIVVNHQSTVPAPTQSQTLAPSAAAPAPIAAEPPPAVAALSARPQSSSAPAPIRQAQAQSAKKPVTSKPHSNQELEY